MTRAPIAQRVAGWIARLILVLFIVLMAELWLDVLVFSPEEYERLIGSEAACGKFAAYCSWRSFLLDMSPDAVLAILAVLLLLWRKLPWREPALGILASAIVVYMAWRVYSTHIEAMMN
jgi:hypothetical protein